MRKYQTPTLDKVRELTKSNSEIKLSLGELIAYQWECFVEASKQVERLESKLENKNE